MNQSIHRSPRTLLMGTLTALALTAGLSSASPASDAPFLELSLTDAAARANAEHQLLVLYFHSEVSPDCARMLKQTWAADSVREWLSQNALAIQVPETDTKLKARFGVNLYPQVILLNPDGMTLLHKTEGFAGPTELLISLSASTLGEGKPTRPEGSDATNPMAWLTWANHLFANEPERSVECLDAYLWCLDTGEEHLAGFRGHYFEFLLQRIAYLRSYTIKAAEALITRRDRQRAAILAGIEIEGELDEYLRYCFWLRDEVDVLDAIVEMRDLGAERDASARHLMRAELNRAVGRKLYSDILRLDPAPVEIIGGRLTELYKTPEDERTASSQFYEKRQVIIADAACYFEALLASSRAGDAFELVDRVVEAAPNGRTFRAFMERTNRLRIYKLTQRLAKQGLEVVGDRGKGPIQAQVKMMESLQAQDAIRAQKEAQDKELEEEGGGQG